MKKSFFAYKHKFEVFLCFIPSAINILSCSNVYGSSETEMRSLRSFEGGLLKATLRGRRHMLPPSSRDKQCDSPAIDRPCFAAGGCMSGGPSHVKSFVKVLIIEVEVVVWGGWWNVTIAYCVVNRPW